MDSTHTDASNGSADGQLFETPEVPAKPKRIRAPRTAPTIATKLRRMAGNVAHDDAIEMNRIADVLDRVLRLAVRDVAPHDGLDVDSRGYLFFRSMLNDALK